MAARKGGRKKAAEVPQVLELIRGYRALAARYEVTDQTIADWIAKGLPKKPVGRGYEFNPEATDPWVELFRKSSGLAATGEDSPATRTRQAREEAKLRRELALAEEIEREQRLKQGNLLNREEWELFAVEVVQRGRDRLRRLPKTLCKWIKQEVHEAFQREAQLEIDKILTEIARSLQRGPDS